MQTKKQKSMVLLKKYMSAVSLPNRRLFFQNYEPIESVQPTLALLAKANIQGRFPFLSRSVAFGVAIQLLVFVQATQLHAAIYSFTDPNGVVHYTNVPNHPKYKVLPQFRDYSSPSLYSSKDFDAIIGEAGIKFEVDPNLIKAIIQIESNFNPRARSPKGAMGLMQLMPSTAKDLNVRNTYDPRENIFAGTRYFKKLYHLLDGDIELALASYNAGPDRVVPTRTIPDIRETKNYVKKVVKAYRHFSRTSYY